MLLVDVANRNGFIVGGVLGIGGVLDLCLLVRRLGTHWKLGFGVLHVGSVATMSGLGISNFSRNRHSREGCWMWDNISGMGSVKMWIGLSASV